MRRWNATSLKVFLPHIGLVFVVPGIACQPLQSVRHAEGTVHANAGGESMASAVESVERAERLAEKGSDLPSALADGWISEVQAEAAVAQLRRLGDVLAATGTISPDAEGEFFDRCLLPPLRPEPRITTALRGVRVERFRGRPESIGRTPPGAAFEAFLAPHQAGDGNVREVNQNEATTRAKAQRQGHDARDSDGNPFLRFDFRVAGIISNSPTDFATDVIVRVGSGAGSSRVQQNARWAVSWVWEAEAENRERETGNGKQVTEAGDRLPRTAAPRIVSILVMEYDELRADRAMLTFSPQFESSKDPVGASGAQPRSRSPRLRGHGIAIGDVNGDGLEDVFVATGAGQANRLLLQQADGSVRDSARESGVDWTDDAGGVLLIDWDNDGDADLVAATGATIVFYENDGRGRFTLRHAHLGAGPGRFGSLAAADFDLDGDLDVYACRSIDWLGEGPAPQPLFDASNGPADVLLRNDGPRGFSDVTAAVGLDAGRHRFSTAAAWADYDGDGDADLFVASEFASGRLFRNDGGRFVDVTAKSGLDFAAIGRAACWADFDGDGDLDLFEGNVFSPEGSRIVFQPRFMEGCDPASRVAMQRLPQGNALYLNQGNGTFLNRADESGVRIGGWTSGATPIDVNGDGLEDLIVTNGLVSGTRDEDVSNSFWRRVAPVLGDPARTAEGPRAWVDLKRWLHGGIGWAGREQPTVFLNLGSGQFCDASMLVEGNCPPGGAVAAVDWDRDYDLDIWVNNGSETGARLVRNERSGACRFVSLRLIGERCNRDAIGARVSAVVGGRQLVRTVEAGSGRLSQSSLWVHIGLGETEQIDELTISWPDARPPGTTGSKSRYENLKSGRYMIRQGETPLPAR
ncbi:MAG: hypothetical protein HBSAPP02_11040 [Phycisphaerae bacterium]|nr:MAG: CRTAC1 family protein [Planctomycetia bacterium]RIK69134.1 MAG: hypothetical protein DCC66_09040 [Planctomycetota bacterium]GJQ26072.1 MAG: hypothetical protein HBSAPP02_11040 [Phycisphaerae bacterium]